MREKINYTSIHFWIRSNFNKPYKCENSKCPRTSKTFDWALIHGKVYSKNRGIFKVLCRSCHMKYDKVGNPNIANYPQTRFKKGLIPWNKGLKMDKKLRKKYWDYWNKSKKIN